MKTESTLLSIAFLAVAFHLASCSMSKGYAPSKAGRSLSAYGCENIN